jgi:hypothetical protein
MRSNEKSSRKFLRPGFANTTTLWTQRKRRIRQYASLLINAGRKGTDRVRPFLLFFLGAEQLLFLASLAPGGETSRPNSVESTK